jgi:hypothetical protein
MKNKPLTGANWQHGSKHNPKLWPWWKRFSLNFHNLPSVHKPTTGYRFWIYTRKKARDFDIYFDRRTKEQLGKK